MRGIFLALALLFSTPAAVADDHAVRIRPVSTSSPVAADDHAARIRPVSTSSPVAASTGWAAELERELMSPYCPGRSLVECPSPQATELRMWIHAQEQAGVSREEVEARLVREFGEETLRHAPRAEGWGLWAYLMPGLVLLAGGVLVVWFLGRSTSAPREAAPPLRNAELEREVDRELGAS